MSQAYFDSKIIYFLLLYLASHFSYFLFKLQVIEKLILFFLVLFVKTYTKSFIDFSFKIFHGQIHPTQYMTSHEIICFHEKTQKLVFYPVGLFAKLIFLFSRLFDMEEKEIFLP